MLYFFVAFGQYSYVTLMIKVFVGDITFNTLGFLGFSLPPTLKLYNLDISPTLALDFHIYLPTTFFPSLEKYLWSLG